MEYATDGNLREYLETHFPTLTWHKRFRILYSIIDNLKYIHSKGYIHKDLHSGNILYFDDYAKITDLGLAQSINQLNSNVCGVLPYVAPEVLDGKSYTFASDIYSFGIIMIEISNGKPPYGNLQHDEKLASAICNGLRPRVASGTPKHYIDLINRCTDANPDNRPTSGELLEEIRGWMSYDVEEFVDVHGKDDLPKCSPEIMLNSEAIYTSRLMSFNNLPKPKNLKGIQIEDPECNKFIMIIIISYSIIKNLCIYVIYLFI